MKRAILALIFLFIFPALSFSDDFNFIGGLRLLNEGSYAAAIGNLASAEGGTVADYALLYKARAYLYSGDYEKALDASKKISALYPDSIAIRDARYIGIISLLALSSGADAEADAVQELEGYVLSFPSDRQMRYLLGYLLKGRDPESAKSVFRELYVEAGPLSGQAYLELMPEDITASDSLRMASNMIKAFRYKEAESLLRSLLSGGPGGFPAGLKANIHDKLGQALFGQKRYPEAGLAYLEAGELYGATRSFFRAGDRERFKELLARLISEGDERAGNLLIAHASELRREGDFKGALGALSKAEKLPGCGEEARYNAGWLYYLKGDYKKALDVFGSIDGNPKYLYWRAKAAERAGADASGHYAAVKGRDYYGVLARMKTGEPTDSSVVAVSTQPESASTEPPVFNGRADILIEAGLMEQAVRELMRMAEGGGNVAAIAARLRDLGRYREAIAIMRALPEDKRPDEIAYPLAYYEDVGKISAGQGIDPLLVLSVMREESRFDPLAYSPAGAMGLMQLMPATAERTAEGVGLEAYDLYSPPDNIRLGVNLLSGLIREFGSVPAALAAYNAGEHNARKWLREGKYASDDEFIEDIPFEETKKYIKRIITSYSRYGRYGRMAESSIPPSPASLPGQ